MASSDAAPNPSAPVEYQLWSGQSVLLHERDEIYCAGTAVGHLERLKMTSTWHGSLREKPTEVRLNQIAQSEHVGASIQVGRVILRFAWKTGRTISPVDLVCDGLTLKLKVNETGGYSVLSDTGVELGTHSFVWRESETSQGVRSKAILTPIRDQDFNDTLGLFLLFLCYFESYTFGG